MSTCILPVLSLFLYGKINFLCVILRRFSAKLSMRPHVIFSTPRNLFLRGKIYVSQVEKKIFRELCNNHVNCNTSLEWIHIGLKNRGDPNQMWLHLILHRALQHWLWQLSHLAKNKLLFMESTVYLPDPLYCSSKKNFFFFFLWILSTNTWTEQHEQSVNFYHRFTIYVWEERMFGHPTSNLAKGQVLGWKLQTFN